MSFKDVASFLRKVGLQKYAEDIWTQRYGDNTFFQVECGIGVSLKTLEYFNSLKKSIGNCVYPDRLGELEIRARLLIDKINTEITLSRKQEFVNRYAIVIYQMAALHRNKSAREHILQEMLNAAPTDVDLTLTKIVYYTKTAVTAIYDRDVATAKRYISQAHELINCGFSRESTWVKGLVWLDQQYLSSCLNLIAPSEEHLRNTCTDGLLGVNIISAYTDINADIIMVKIFMTVMAMSLLNISNDFLVDTTKSVSEDDKRKAEQFLNALLQRNTDHEQMEIRREMIISLCRARICEDKDLKSAKFYARAALELAPEGVHFRNHVVNIEQYYTYLQNKTLTKCLTES